MNGRLFADIIGQDRAKQYFLERLQGRELSHAYCFKGAGGIGKRRFAMSLIREQLCAGNTADYLKFDSANHPDFLAIVSDAAILTEQVNDVRQFIYKKPLLAPLKAILFDDAANLNESAQNKLLKILEDPPGEILLIFITSRPDRLLPTVASRLTHINFSPLSGDQMKQLIARYNLEYDDVLLGLSAGSFGSYMRLQTDEVFAARSRALIDLLVSAIAANSNQWLFDIDLLDQYKGEPGHLFYLLKLALRDVLVYATTDSVAQLKLLKQYDIDNIVNKPINRAAIYGMIREINRAERAIERGQNYSLVSETLFFNIEEAFNG